MTLYDLTRYLSKLRVSMNERMNEIAYISVRWKTRTTTARIYETDGQSIETENGRISRESQSGVSMVRDLWRKDRFTEEEKGS